MMGNYMGAWGGVGAWFGPLWMVIWWGGLAALIFWGIARLTRSDTVRSTSVGNGASPSDARAILDRRFAAGELDAESYARARRLLEEPVNPGGPPIAHA
jgi:putative membrane protein